MKEIQDIATWIESISRPEDPFPALSEWLELESRRSTRRHALGLAIVGGCFAGVATMVAGIATIAEASFEWDRGGSSGVSHLLLALLGATITVLPPYAGTAAISRWLVRRRTQAVDPEVARAVANLRSMRNARRLRKRLGKNGAIELNEGAVLYFRCRMALMSDAWNSQSPSEPWGEVRAAMLQAMEAAMGRLALCVFKRRSFTEIGPILEEMRAASNEAVRVTELRAHTAGSAGQGLRASTNRMRELAKTEEEALAELRISL